MSEEKTGGSKTTMVITIIVGVILLFAVAGYFGWRYYQAKKVDDLANQIMANPDAFKNGASPTTSTKTSGKIDQNLVGTWESDCLVPDAGSPWAEKHKYVINSDGTAVHTRQDWPAPACNSEPVGLITDQIKLSIPAAGKINQTIVSETNSRPNPNAPASNAVMYDIYKVSGNTLEFGWGFRGDSLAYDGQTGSSDADRFTTLNSFIVYHK